MDQGPVIRNFLQNNNASIPDCRSLIFFQRLYSIFHLQVLIRIVNLLVLLIFASDLIEIQQSLLRIHALDALF